MKIRAVAIRSLLLASAGLFPLASLACLPAQYSVPTASVNDFFEADALIALVSAHQSAPEKSRNGITRFKVVRWLKGTGPEELDAKGFTLLDERSPMFNSCRLGTLYPGKQYIVILDEKLVEGVARAFSKQHAAGKLVVERAWEAP